eukprot:scaffold104499_cov30-Phaeocystis_antarctica.AAC.1
MVNVAPSAAPQLGSSASPGRAWRLRAARHSQGEAGPPGAQPLPRVLERAASKVADSPRLRPCRRGRRATPSCCAPRSTSRSSLPTSATSSTPTSTRSAEPEPEPYP